MRTLLLAMALLVASLAQAQSAAPQVYKELDLSYVYAPLFGTGVYQAGAETCTVFKLSAEYLLDQPEPEGDYWLLPVTIGSRQLELDQLPEQPGQVFEAELSNVTFLPGLAHRFRPDRNWVISPSVQLGLAQDLDLDQTHALYTAALRATGQWLYGDQQLTWGNRLRLAGQDGLGQGAAQGFMLLESGFEWDLPLRLELAGQALRFSSYFYASYFIQDTGIKGVSGEKIGANNLYNLGFTLGWQQPVSVLGIPIERVGLTWVSGSDVQALTLNLGFPLAAD